MWNWWKLENKKQILKIAKLNEVIKFYVQTVLYGQVGQRTSLSVENKPFSLKAPHTTIICISIHTVIKLSFFINSLGYLKLDVVITTFDWNRHWISTIRVVSLASLYVSYNCWVCMRVYVCVCVRIRMYAILTFAINNTVDKIFWQMASHNLNPGYISLVVSIVFVAEH